MKKTSYKGKRNKEEKSYLFAHLAQGSTNTHLISIIGKEWRHEKEKKEPHIRSKKQNKKKKQERVK